MTLAILVGDTPPSEFRIFKAGENETTKGTYVFDDVAAREVMSAYQKQGVDVMLDLEHLSLEPIGSSANFDPDARGWCKLAVRNGELWAVDVSWTPDGEARLREKRQRYISPAFLYDTDTNRITNVLNIAITALPATHNVAPLVAASARMQRLALEGENMNPEQFAAIAEALGLGADANVEDVVATISAMVKKVQDAANGVEDPAAEDPPVAASAEPVPAVIAARKLSAASRILQRLSGKRDFAQAITEVEAWRTSHLELESNRAKLAKDRATLEAGERRRLVADMVKLGAEPPATAWADDTATTPAEPWASMALESLRSRVAKLSKKPGTTTTTTTTPPTPKTGADEAGGVAVTVRGGEVVQLSASEVEACTAANAKVEDYAFNKLTRLRAKKTTAQA